MGIFGCGLFGFFGVVFFCILRRNLGINLQNYLIFTCWSYDYAHRYRKQLGTANHILIALCVILQCCHGVIISLRLEKSSKSNKLKLSDDA